MTGEVYGDITVCIPTIPGREDRLCRALESVRRQSLQPAHIVVQRDDVGTGAARTRQRAVDRATNTTWLAFLDDDDLLDECHLEMLYEQAAETGADLVYPWFRIVDSKGRDTTYRDPLRVNGESPYGRGFDEIARNHLLTKGNFIPVTVLVRRQAIIDVGGFPVPGTPDWPYRDCEDWGLWIRLLEAGAEFRHLSMKTWTWTWDGRNTSGQAKRARKLAHR